jgi:hypothetical protein
MLLMPRYFIQPLSPASPACAEINHSPSFNIDSPLDRAVKEAVIGDTLALVAPLPRAAARAKRSQRSAAEARLLAGLRPQQQAEQEQPRGIPGPRQGRTAGRKQQAGMQVLSGCIGSGTTSTAGQPCPDQEPIAEQQQDTAQGSKAVGAAAAGGEPGSPGGEPTAKRPARKRQLGGFDRVHPVHKQPELQAVYDELLGLAERLFRAGTAAGAPTTPRAAASPPSAKAEQIQQQPDGAAPAAAGTKEAQGGNSAASGGGLRAVRLLHNSFARPGSADRHTLIKAGRATA